mmetsp:Transcript_11244/g.17015  ORF Transcript_11244/g.17015 Transcript_11244/m.17015 type:complete len:195 (+) Transcript_11244:221-805(+)
MTSIQSHLQQMSVHKALIFITLGISIYILCYDSIILRKTMRVMSLRSNSNYNNNYNYSSKSTTTVFYNLYTRDDNDVERVREMVVDQLSFLLPDQHDQVFITAIGARQDDIPSFLPHSITQMTQMIQYHPEGGEDLTLHALWDPNPNPNPIYANHRIKTALRLNVPYSLRSTCRMKPFNVVRLPFHDPGDRCAS